VAVSVVSGYLLLKPQPVAAVTRVGEASARAIAQPCEEFLAVRRVTAACAGVGGAVCQWTRHGEKIASISLRAEHDRLHLTYRVRIGGGEWEDVSDTVRIVRVACRFGGARLYFICPAW
jgi:hypothetical protein